MKPSGIHERFTKIKLIRIALLAALSLVFQSPNFQPANAETYDLAWTFVSSANLIPGTFADATVPSLQDNGRNSSFVVSVKNGQKPISGATIHWSSSDPTSSIQYQSSSTDADGLARMWYLVGQKPNATVSAEVLGSPNKISVQISLKSKIPKTVGRYVTAFFDAPALTQSYYKSIEVSATPLTAPLNTHYSFTNIFNEQYTETLLYGGIQRMDCGAPTPSGRESISRMICAKSRGNERGYQVIFSAWNIKVDKLIRKSKIIKLGPKTKCMEFSNEGSGLQCFALFDWKVNEKVIWLFEYLGEDKSGNFLVRASARSGNSKSTEIAIYGLPEKPDLSHFAFFNENWGGNESKSCLDVQPRAIRLESIFFISPTSFQSPTVGYLNGQTYPNSTLCQNYSLLESKDGITIRSGGLNNWVQVLKSEDLGEFKDENQLLFLRQKIQLDTLPVGR